MRGVRSITLTEALKDVEDPRTIAERIIQGVQGCDVQIRQKLCVKAPNRMNSSNSEHSNNKPNQLTRCSFAETRKERSQTVIQFGENVVFRVQCFHRSDLCVFSHESPAAVGTSRAPAYAMQSFMPGDAAQRHPDFLQTAEALQTTRRLLQMVLVHDYMRNDDLRHRLNTLTQKIFGFDFEDWVTGGYFEGDYIPYSFMEDERILANVSVNRMYFIQNGVRKNYVQIGTVMTDESCRKQGLARQLMEHVFKEYEDKCDGIYLFGDLKALDFYRKLALKESVEYQYSLKQSWLKREKQRTHFRKVEEKDEQIKLKYMDAVRNSAVNAALEQVNKFGLQMFYTADLCDVYYADGIDCFVVMEKLDDTVTLKSVISKEQVSMKEVISYIDAEYSCLRLGFVPRAKDAYMFEASVYDGGNDYRLFYRGKELESIEKERLLFPKLSHA